MIGIISAMIFEKQRLIEMIQPVEEKEMYGICFSIGKINNNPVVVASCGEGKVNAARCAQIMICTFNVTAIINVGVAGSMNENVKRGDIIIASDVVQHDYDMTAIGVPLGLVPNGIRTEEHPWGDRAEIYVQCSKEITNYMCSYLSEQNIKYHLGKIATGDIFVADRELKQRISENFDVIACEMEGAAIAYVCECADVSFAEIRDISDNADDTANDNYWPYKEKYSLERILFEIIYNCKEGF